MTPLGSRARRITLLAAAWLAVSTGHCSSCQQTGFIAELVHKRNVVERDFSSATNAWRVAKIGDRLEMGDGLRTASKAQATLALPQRGRLLVKSDTVVRFVRSLQPGTPSRQFEVLQGELSVETGGLTLGVRTSRTVVRLARGSSVVVHAEQGKTRFEVDVGRVEYALDGKQQVVEAGGGFELDVLHVSVEAQAQRGASVADGGASAASSARQGTPVADGGVRTAPADKAADRGDDRARSSPADVVDAPGARRSTSAGDDEAFADPPPRALVTFAGGETVTIHDPAPPTDIGVTFGGCPQSAVLELARGRGRFDAIRVRGHAELRARVPPGAYRYRVRCMQQGHIAASAAARGHVRVMKDAATRPLPLSPVTISADADGRRYTVSYQNRLPTITLRWPYAPRASTYRLTVQPALGAQFSLPSSRPSVTLPAGRLGEGLHHFWFETPDHKRSEGGVLQVSFDYTARAAYLTSPREGAARGDGTARFAGGTLLGSKVYLAGAPMRLDAHGRFAGAISLPAQAEGAAVRVEHPSAGIHYYVRHLRP